MSKRRKKSRSGKRVKQSNKARVDAKSRRQPRLSEESLTIQQAVELAMKYHNAGELAKAKDIYQRVLEKDPCQPAALNLLGAIVLQAGENDRALELITKSLAIKPDYVAAHSNLGNVHRKAGRLGEAVASYQKALSLNPAYDVALKNLGSAQWGLGCVEEAIASYDKVLARYPDHADTHSKLGEIYEKTNSLDKAEFHIQKALEKEPSLQEAIIRKSALLRRRGKGQEAIEILEELTLNTELSGVDYRSYFELGKLYDRALDSEKAYSNFAKGNQLQNQGMGANIRPEQYTEVLDHTSKGLTREMVDAWQPDAGAAEVESPVFLIGFPRSGTTLLDQILDSHPRLQVMEEKPAIKSCLSKIQHQPGGYPAILAKLEEAEIQDLRQVYFDRVKQHIDRRPGTTLVDKFPLNTGHIPLIMRLFPNSRVILALRHPCDVVLSNFMQMYRLNSAMANFHTLEDAARLYEKVMNLWLKCTELFSINYLSTRYEDLVADQEGESRRLLKFLDVDWNDVVLDFYTHAKQRGKIDTPSYEQVSQPIYQRAKYRWRRYKEQLKPVLPQLEPFIKEFGYTEPKSE
jgi:tetratricopeptide (TPR) repeat protein